MSSQLHQSCHNSIQVIISLSLDRITAWAKSFQNCTWGNQLFGGIVSKRQVSRKHTRSKLNRGTNKVQIPDQASLGTELFYQSPSMPKVSRNLTLFESLKEESWFSVSMAILNQYHFFVCNGTFPKAKLRQLRGEILRQRLVDLFYSKKIQLLVMKQKNRQFLHKSKIGSLKKYFVTHSSVCNRIQTTPNLNYLSRKLTFLSGFLISFGPINSFFLPMAAAPQRPRCVRHNTQGP